MKNLFLLITYNLIFKLFNQISQNITNNEWYIKIDHLAGFIRLVKLEKYKNILYKKHIL